VARWARSRERASAIGSEGGGNSEVEGERVWER
jgi:hypothetical protein